VKHADAGTTETEPLAAVIKKHAKYFTR